MKGGDNMQGGFSFCGMDIAKLGIYYAPERDDTLVYKNSGFSQQEEKFAAKDGSVNYGTTVSAKEFTLRCIFEDKHFNQGIIDNVLNFFYKDRTGKLVFDSRDWCYYIAQVVEVTPNITNRYNGYIIIRLKAYYPYARTDFIYKSNDTNIYDLYEYDADDDIPITGGEISAGESGIHYWPYTEEMDFDAPDDTNEHIMNGNIFANDSATSYFGLEDSIDFYVDDISEDTYVSNTDPFAFTADDTIENKAFFLTQDQMPPVSYSNVTASMSFLLYNAGNAPAALGIEVQGNAGNGLIIKNNTTDQEMKLILFTQTETTDAGCYVYTDGLNAKTSLTGSTTNRLALFYHDYGFINLAPAAPEYQDVQFLTTQGSANIFTNQQLMENCIGKYICIENVWYKILSVTSDNIITVDNAVSQSGIYVSNIVTMNEMTLTFSGNARIDNIIFVYKHTFR